eukprot:TRINITY_DN27765_c0_g2_i1.p1 TRINITY_DN27765_c0_g2~~TRINITY_DN27765_c0_g2_i1.p1  ORF type:complete len:102 (-),score=1.64 TRINITY_DN27765_c0_g2_i1:37-315(-)
MCTNIKQETSSCKKQQITRAVNYEAKKQKRKEMDNHLIIITLFGKTIIIKKYQTVTQILQNYSKLALTTCKYKSEQYSKKKSQIAAKNPTSA